MLPMDALRCEFTMDDKLPTYALHAKELRIVFPSPANMLLVLL
jgi:hypothetical protein